MSFINENPFLNGLHSARYSFVVIGLNLSFSDTRDPNSVDDANGINTIHALMNQSVITSVIISINMVTNMIFLLIVRISI